MLNPPSKSAAGALVFALVLTIAPAPSEFALAALPPGQRPAPADDAAAIRITAADCTAGKIGTSIAPSAIGEPVKAVTLAEPSWVEAANEVPAHCRVNGTMAPVDPAPTARAINFSVVLPASWNRRAAQLGGGGINGVIPNLTAGPGGSSLLTRGLVTYGSDSGHQASFGRRGGPPATSAVSDDWTLNEEAKNLGANPLDYVEGGAFDKRRRELSAILDSTNPDLSAFAKRGGRMIVTIGTNDTLASPGAQLDYYQSIVERMGRATLDRFARLFVMPQTGHGLSGTNYGQTGDGRMVPTVPIPNRYDQVGLLFDWVENGKAPGMSVTVTAGEKSLPLCSYPTYPRYKSGPADSAASYQCGR